MEPWIILDRDGVINVDSDAYVKSAEEWIPIPSSIEAIAQLCNANYQVAIVSNQSGIGRGLFGIDELDAMHAKLSGLVEQRGGVIAGIFYCPHTPDDNCACRKPKAGMLDELEREFNISLEGVPFVGDSERDIQAAQLKMCTPVLVRTGKGGKTEKKFLGDAQYQSIAIYDDLASYVQTLLAK